MMKTIGERIIFLRENMDITQTALAKLIGISKMTLYKYEKDVCSPRAEIILNLAKALNTTADFLVGRTNDYMIKTENEGTESQKSKEIGLIKKLRQLSPENQIRIEERIDMLLDNQLK